VDRDGLALVFEAGDYILTSLLTVGYGVKA